MQNDRLEQQLEFILELDKLKNVIRQNYINHGERRENTAEHSWQVALQAVVLAEYANEEVDILRVVKMLLIHDVVEILAGDTYIYDAQMREEQEDKEREAAETLFGMLPAPQSEELKALWFEFEGRKTADSRFAKSMDRLLPMLQNVRSKGKSWTEHGVTKEMVLENALNIRPGSEALYTYAVDLIQRAAQEGIFQSKTR